MNKPIYVYMGSSNKTLVCLLKIPLNVKNDKEFKGSFKYKVLLHFFYVEQQNKAYEAKTEFGQLTVVSLSCTH